jgi:hypothetical protein
MDYSQPTVLLLIEVLLAKGQFVTVELHTPHGNEQGNLEGIVQTPGHDTYQVSSLNIMRRQPYSQTTICRQQLESASLKKDGAGWAVKIPLEGKS